MDTFFPEPVEENQSQNCYCIIGATVTGPLHVINGVPCQDAFAFEVFANGVAAIAMADGLGSASKSEIGAKVAVDAAVSSVKRIVMNNLYNKLDLSDVVKDSVSYARQRLEEKAVDLQCKLRDLACTLILVAINGNVVAVAQIGDGAVIAKTEKGLSLISAPGDSEYANEVTPLTEKEWEISLRISPNISDVCGVMVFTDGCQRAALQKTSGGILPFMGFCDPLFSYAEAVIDTDEGNNDISNLLSSKKICDNSEDDKTLVIAILGRSGKREGTLD